MRTTTLCLLLCGPLAAAPQLRPEKSDRYYREQVKVGLRVMTDLDYPLTINRIDGDGWCYFDAQPEGWPVYDRVKVDEVVRWLRTYSRVN